MLCRWFQLVSPTLWAIEGQQICGRIQEVFVLPPGNLAGWTTMLFERTLWFWNPETGSMHHGVPNFPIGLASKPVSKKNTHTELGDNKGWLSDSSTRWTEPHLVFTAQFSAPSLIQVPHAMTAVGDQPRGEFSSAVVSRSEGPKRHQISGFSIEAIG